MLSNFIVHFKLMLKIFSQLFIYVEYAADTWLFVYKSAVVYFGTLRGIWTSLGRPCQITWSSKARPSSCVQYTRHTCHYILFQLVNERERWWLGEWLYLHMLTLGLKSRNTFYFIINILNSQMIWSSVKRKRHTTNKFTFSTYI